MAFGGRVTASSGVLLRLKEQLNFIKKSCEILKMKRDHIAGEVNTLLLKIEARGDIEKKLMESYEEFKLLFVEQGYSKIHSLSLTVSHTEIDLRTVNIMGVEVLGISIVKMPNQENISNLSAYKAARKLSDRLPMIVSISEIEHRIEILTKELMIINRKVNSLEKVVIPNIGKLINNIEDKLEEESLEEFFKSKIIKAKGIGNKYEVT